MYMQYNNTGAFHINKNITIINSILGGMPGLSRIRRIFIGHILTLFLLVRGRNNFTNLSRYGYYHERSYRYQFEQKFDWFTFNTQLVRKHTSEDRIIVFDPSFVPKSRHETPHTGMFWSGASGQSLWGVEAGVLAVVDVARNTALSLEAVQTPTAKELSVKGLTLVDHYTSIITKHSKELASLAIYLVVDGYFAKQKFFDGVLNDTPLHIITKLRHDANLQYLYEGTQTGIGRPKQFDGKVDWKEELPTDKWETIVLSETERLLSTITYSPSLKRRLHTVIVQIHKADIWKTVAVLASSDTTINASILYKNYRARFQIEFLFRDAKQYAGLTHCQARSENKLNFHWNTSLTSISVAKVAHFFDPPEAQRSPYSLQDVGMSYFNQFFTKFVFSKLDYTPEPEKMVSILPSLLSFGLIHT